VDQHLLTPILLSALVCWAVYRRVRRSFGRQPVHERRMQVRLAVLTLIGVLVLLASARDGQLLAALMGGVACGLALGYLGLRHTRIEATPQGRFYTPHTYIGLFVTALFLSRLIFRLLTVHLSANAAGQADMNPFAGYQRSPLTIAMFGVLLGYYVFYILGVLKKSRELSLPATDTPPAVDTPES
jgi:hypothetical protein